MNAKELMIGNLVNYSIANDGKMITGRITSVYQTNDEERKGVVDYHYPLSWAKPIPLSPDILLKCGFKSDHDSHFGGWLLGINNGEQIRIVWDENIGWHWPMNGYNKPLVNYLHQLQNLIFCLTGQELNIKL